MPKTRSTVFDLVIAAVLGSTISRVVTGDAPFLPGLAAAAVLIGMHWIFSAVALRRHGFGWP